MINEKRACGFYITSLFMLLTRKEAHMYHVSGKINLPTDRELCIGWMLKQFRQQMRKYRRIPSWHYKTKLPIYRPSNCNQEKHEQGLVVYMRATTKSYQSFALLITRHRQKFTRSKLPNMFVPNCAILFVCRDVIAEIVIKQLMTLALMSGRIMQ